MLVTSLPLPTTFTLSSLQTCKKTKTTPVHCSSPPPPQSPMDPQSKRVAVCGGGVIGVCTAYFLAKKGASVTLIEKSSVACAASGKSGGFLALDCFNLHRSLAEELNGAESYGYRPLPTLSLTVSESEKQSPPSRDKNLPCWIDGPARGLRAIGSTETTAQVHPQMFTKALLSKAVEKYGVEVVIGKVDSVGVEGGRVESVVLEGGRVIESDSVVLALGPWSGKFEMLSSLFRVYGLRVHSIVLEPKEPDAITPHALFLSYYPEQGGKPMESEVFPRPTGEVYLCGVSSEVELPEDPEQIAGDPESLEVLKRVASTVSSHLGEGEARLKAEQACFLPCTDDSVPVIGEIPGVKGCYVATGHNCWGILNGPATGAAMAELIVDGQATVVDLARFSPARFVGRRRKG
ncbi:SARCOSINE DEHYDROGENASE-RELATED [Salix viminalis]|uniref:SARCOSINE DEHYDROGENASE-RELATED n=1 Tax=Salix viminalis TaxID=40686 RepID=A0A9Q0ZK21_SALVM|nr:SARCOSINE DEHYDROGENASE-RELATED [Salix viminalis]